MRVNNWISFVCIMAAIAIGVAIVALISEIDLIEPGWCNGRANCLREWLGALSGWAAAAGAVMAALLTLPYLRRQVYEARRQADEAKQQTDYLTGKGEPSVDAIQHQHYQGVVVVRITNWNRGPVILKEVAFADPSVVANLLKIEMMDKERPDAGFRSRELIEHRLVPQVPMHGWKDRSKGPCEVRIDLTAKLVREDALCVDWSGMVVAVTIASAGVDGKEHVYPAPVAGVVLD